MERLQKHGTKLSPMYDTNLAAIYDLDRTGGGQNIAIGALFAKTNVAAKISYCGAHLNFIEEKNEITTITGH